MNRRWMLTRLLAGLLVSVFCYGGLSMRLAAQERRAAPQRQPRKNLQQPNLRREQADPRLDKILKLWAQSTAKIEKLQGEHERLVYDKVFQVVKAAEGKFYYEAPDKGRIDIQPRIPNKDKPTIYDRETKIEYKIQPDQPERWICNGTEIHVINDEDKQDEIVPIPKEAQGPNIMDGPLPFLFGMPPAKAKQRYYMRLMGIKQGTKETNPTALLEVKPRLAHDAANWQLARVILDLKTFLPQAVKLWDPAGNAITMYQFKNLEVNAKENFFQQVLKEDPFNPKLRGYKKVVFQGADFADQASKKVSGVPSVQGLSVKQAVELLRRAGYEVKYQAGKPADRPDFTHVVYEQLPKPGAEPTTDKVVTITYYDLGRTTAKPPVGTGKQ